MKTLLITAIATLMVSFSAHAFFPIDGQENEGMTFGKQVLWTCISDVGDDGVDIIQSNDSTYAQYWFENEGGGHQKYNYAVAQRQLKSGVMGQPLEYAGKEVNLSIGTTTAPTSQGQTSSLSVKGFTNGYETVYCQSGNQR